MADTKISGLPAASAAAAANELVINEAGTSKKLTVAQLQEFLGIHKARLNADHVISSTTGTEVMSVNGLVAGTYCFQMFVIVRSATTTVGPMLGVNFTGTTSLRNFWMRWSDATSAITAQAHIMDDVGILTMGYHDSVAHNAFSTTAPNMGTTLGVAATAANILCIIEGMFINSTTGDLELWHSSETATSTSVMTGTSIIATRTA
jgi:hypothetical protein